MKRTFDVITSILATVARLRYAERVGMIGPRPAKPLVLYEFEGCPFCRKVREALTVLDLEALIYPCPKGGTRIKLCGKCQCRLEKVHLGLQTLA